MRIRWTRTVKWAGAALTLALLAVLAASLACPVRVYRVTASGGSAAQLANGRLQVVHSAGYGGSPRFNVTWLRIPWRMNWRPYWETNSAFGFWEAVIPLWMPISVSFFVAAAAWRLDVVASRRAPAHPCTKCGYDLTGNTTGICPECGKASPAESPSGT